MKKRKVMAGICCTAMAATVMLSGCSLFKYQEEDTVALSTPMKIEYTMYTVIKGDIEKSVSGMATVTSLSTNKYCAPYSGLTISEFNVRSGNEVKTGDTLVTFTNGTTITATADGTVRYINQEYLYKNNDTLTVSANDVMVVVDPEVMSNAQAILSLERSVADEYDISIGSVVTMGKSGLTTGDTFEGVVVGSSRVAEDTLAEVESTEDVSEEESDDSKHKKGENNDWSEELYSEDSSSSTQSQYITFYIDLSGAPENISVGDRLSVKYVEAESKDCLKIPTDALYSYNGKNFVYVLNSQGLKEQKTVEVGLYGETFVEIVSGLELGQQIVQY